LIKVFMPFSSIGQLIGPGRVLAKERSTGSQAGEIMVEKICHDFVAAGLRLCNGDHDRAIAA